MLTRVGIGIAAVVLLLTTSIAGQNSGHVYPVGEFPVFVAVGDLDHNGWPDIVTANLDSRDVSVMLNLGDGSFAPAVSHDPELEPSYVALTDTDQDGNLDILTGGHSLFGGGTTVFLGRGDGTFADGVRSPSRFTSISVAAADFDQDGWPDIVTANTNSDDVTVRLGHGNGTFAPEVRYAVGRQGSSVAVGDFDQDGLADIVVANNGSGDVTLLSGYGDGTFADGVSYRAGGNAIFVLVDDCNRDGRDDVVVGMNYGQGRVTVLLGRGDGTFEDYLASLVPYPYGSGSLAVGDFDQDGRSDLATVSRPYRDSVSVLLGRGDGTFGDGRAFVRGAGLSSVAVGDFNQDGRDDIVTASSLADNVSIMRYPPILVDVDIKPDSDTNVVNLGRHGLIPVAILGSDTFDVADVDVTTLALGHGRVPIAHRNGHIQDVNHDGIADLLTHFRKHHARIRCWTDSIALTGDTFDGQLFEGADSVQPVGCQSQWRPAIWLRDPGEPGRSLRKGPVTIERK